MEKLMLLAEKVRFIFQVEKHQPLASLRTASWAFLKRRQIAAKRAITAITMNLIAAVKHGAKSIENLDQGRLQKGWNKFLVF
jgi:hypothetical protein